MNPSSPIFFFVIFFFSGGYVSGESPPPSGEDHPYRTGDLVANFEPSLAVVTGVLSIMFTLTFVLLVYAKCCHSDLRSDGGGGEGQNRHGGFFNGLNSSERFSGLDKTAIESLPFFRFSALKGSKDGLDCAVCLSKFEDVEILRVLPNCRHAFHIGCIDQWLEQHATCPLCRNRIAIDDPSVFAYTNSLRFLNQSETREDSNLEIYIEREEDDEHHHNESSTRLSIGESFRKILKMRIKEKSMHRFNHRIVVSDVVFKHRWSNVTSSDLMLLNSQMANSISSEGFSSSMDRLQTRKKQEGISRIKEEMEIKRMFENKLMISMNPVFVSENRDSDFLSDSRMVETERRSVSEITAVPRRCVLQAAGTKNAVHGNNSGSTATAFASCSQSDSTEERRRRLWLPIARRTAQWFANREQRAQINTTHQHLDV